MQIHGPEIEIPGSEHLEITSSFQEESSDFDVYQRLSGNRADVFLMNGKIFPNVNLEEITGVFIVVNFPNGKTLVPWHEIRSIRLVE